MAGKPRAEPVPVVMQDLAPGDERRVVKSQQAKKAEAMEAKTAKVPKEPESGWPFRITRKEALEQLATGADRISEYSERVEWVSRNMGSPLASPERAPCNASWALLLFATDNPKDFFNIERQVMAKQHTEAEAEVALDADLSRLQELIDSFSCYRELNDRVNSGEIVLNYE